MPPLVSICVPCYNSSNFIVETLNSIEKQSYPNIELIIIDDNSTDGTYNCIKLWASKKDWVSVFKNPTNIGVVKTANILLEKCKGDYIQFVGHDDLLMPDKIEKMMGFKKYQSDDVGMIYSNVAVIDESGRVIEPDYLTYQGYDSRQMDFDDITGELLSFNFIPAISVLLKTECVRCVGKFDESLCFEDLDMWLRISLKYKIVFFPEVTAMYRKNQNSMMHDRKNRINVLASVLNCREKYRGIKPEWDKIINTGIVKLALELYRHRHPSGKYWLRKRLKYDKHLKSWIYWSLSLFNSRILWKN